jgi:hypothetical protein
MRRHAQTWCWGESAYASRGSILVLGRINAKTVYVTSRARLCASRSLLGPRVVSMVFISGEEAHGQRQIRGRI